MSPLAAIVPLQVAATSLLSLRQPNVSSVQQRFSPEPLHSSRAYGGLSPVEFILAVAVDLALASIPLALWFAACGTVFGVISFALHLRYGGSGFLLQLFTPRAYTVAYIGDRLRDVLGPLLVPIALALLVAFAVRKDPRRRILAILMAAALAIGCYFAGGHGVYINCLFGAVFTMCMLLGLFWDSSSPTLGSVLVRDYAPSLLFLWLVIPMWLNEDLNTARSLRAIRAATENQSREIDLLSARPGQALCESLLICYEAGKRYVFDPFNATRLMTAGKLDQEVMIRQVRGHAYSAIQFETTASNAEDLERFPPAVIAAIEENYQPLNVSLASGVIYVPKLRPPGE